MLSEVLKLMTQEGNVAVTEIAQTLGWSIQRVENTIAQLEGMGYIRKMAAGTSCSGSGCTGCSLESASACQLQSERLFSWVITERGKKALN